ncbi:MAG: exodeoxyribonuclease VII small subunit [Actinomycetota bacterium]|nr:exodeoxyribonuclease VII small subunit [Actinomycetota bacterium]
MSDGENAPSFDDMSFEELVTRLERLTERLASNEIGIEEAADLYEQAELLHGLAAERLARVQARIERLGVGGGQGLGAG